MLPASNNELTDDELNELEKFLFHDSGLEAPMSISEIDGLLTAVVIGPVFPPPSQWMLLVWGDEEGPEFASHEQAARIIGLLMQHMNFLSRQFKEDPDGFDPMLLVGLDEDRKPVTIADHWCMGFMAGVGLNVDAWAEVEEVLLPIILFASEPGDPEVDDELEKNNDYWINKIASTVTVVYKHWLGQRSTEGSESKSTFIRAEPKVGRNDPCPCGSGKKYKKCCGLH